MKGVLDTLDDSMKVTNEPYEGINESVLSNDRQQCIDWLMS